MASSGNLASRLPFLFMGTFFAYACYVQMNDPDQYPWMALYGVAALAGFLATLGLSSLASLTAVIAAGGAAAMLSLRILHPPSCDMGANIIEFAGHKVTLDVNTEDGRENIGLLIVLSWNLLAAVSSAGASLSAFSTLALLATAGAILASAVLIPAYVMSPDKIQEYPHCSGLGFAPDLTAAASAAAHALRTEEVVADTVSAAAI